MKDYFCIIVGFVTSLFTTAMGGFSIGLKALLLFMVIDYITGMIVAGVFHASKKTDGGRLESRAGFKGLCRKGMIIFLVLIAHYLDLVTGMVYIRDGVIIAFLVNETISIIENAGLMGIEIPKPLLKSIEILQQQGEKHGENKTTNSEQK